MTPLEPSRGAEAEPDGHGRGQRSHGHRDPQRRDAWRGLDQASIMSVELIAAIGTWGAIGWLLDRWLGIEPWLFGTGVMVGFAAGLYLVWLRTQPQEDASRDPPPPRMARGIDTQD